MPDYTSTALSCKTVFSRANHRVVLRRGPKIRQKREPPIGSGTRKNAKNRAGTGREFASANRPPVPTACSTKWVRLVVGWQAEGEIVARVIATADRYDDVLLAVDR